jgi:hypothetical protein
VVKFGISVLSGILRFFDETLRTALESFCGEL